MAKNYPSPARLRLFKVLFNQVKSGATSLRTVQRILKDQKIRATPSQMSYAISDVEKAMDYEAGTLFGRGKSLRSPEDGLWNSPQTKKAMEWVMSVLSAYENPGQSQLSNQDNAPPHCHITVTTENFLASTVFPKLLQRLNTKQRMTVRLSLREVPSLFAGLDDHRRSQTDLLFHSLRPAKGSTKHVLPRIDGLDVEDCEIGLSDVVLIPRKERFAALLESNRPIAIEELHEYPLAFVEYPDAAWMFDQSSAARVGVDSISTSIRFALSGDFVGMAHNWPREIGEQHFMALHPRILITPRPPLRIAIFTRRRPAPAQEVKDFVDALLDFIDGESKLLRPRLQATSGR